MEDVVLEIHDLFVVNWSVSKAYLRYKSKSVEATKKIAEHLVKKYMKKEKYCVLLKGEFGAGKTTFVRFCIDYLLGKDAFNGSPSFTIVNEYDGNIYHMDLYRIGGESDLMESGVIEYLEMREGLFFVEWPKGEIHCDMVVNFSILGENERIMDVELRD